MSLSKNIKQLRKERNISQQELAVICKLSISTLQKLEQGIQKNPSLDVLLALSKTLNTSIDKLVK